MNAAPLRRVASKTLTELETLVASRIGAEAGTLRRIFPDDDSLMIAVAEQALIRLMDSCTKAVVKINPDDAVGQFLALGNAYIRWAADHSVQQRRGRR